MTQVVVNFLLPTTQGSSVLTTDPRVFDFSISPNAQAYYNYEYAQIIAGLGGQIQIPGGGTVAPTAANIDSGPIVYGGTTNATQVSDAINLLNNWAAMQQVNQSGFQTASFGAIGTQLMNAAAVLNTDGSGNIQVPGTIPAFGGTPEIIQNSSGTFTTIIPSDLATAAIATGDNSLGTNGLTTTMNSYMAQALTQLISTLRAAGWDPIMSPGAGASATTAIANLTGNATSAIYGITNVLAQGISAAVQANIIGNAALTDSMSIQQVLMVDYVSTGNQILFNEMQQLQTAVNLNQQALSYLNSLQSLMNQKNPQTFVMQLQQLNNVNVNTTNPQSQFDTFEQDTYNQALNTISNLSSTHPSTYAAYFSSLAGVNGAGAVSNAITSSDPLALGAFGNLASAVQVVGNYSVGIIVSNLQYLIQQIGASGGATTAGGLLQSLHSVLSDFTGLQAQNPATAIQTWIQDAAGSSPGQFQQDLSNAVVSSQSFNDTERENLREVMFVYEEFYKSATGLLSTLDTLLKKMADAIAH